MNAEVLSVLEEDAYCLMEAAVLLDQARNGESGDDIAVLEAALNNNLEIWVAIRSVISQPVNVFPDDVKENLTRLADYVASITCTHGGDISTHALETLININLQISEGLLESDESSDSS